MSPAKRALDLGLALAGLLVLWPLILGLALAILWRDGRPVLHLSRRMQTPGRSFLLVKFRTMRPAVRDNESTGDGITGGDTAARITPLGAILRRHRLDELPQLWNILRGDISVVGPRPPLPHYVAACPETYAAVLRCRPGLTGLATVVFRAREARLLAACRTPAQTQAVYRARCVPAKARLDLIYARRRSLALDLLLIWRTFRPGPIGLTPPRRRALRPPCGGKPAPMCRNPVRVIGMLTARDE